MVIAESLSPKVVKVVVGPEFTFSSYGTLKRNGIDIIRPRVCWWMIEIRPPLP